MQYSRKKRKEKKNVKQMESGGITRIRVCIDTDGGRAEGHTGKEIITTKMVRFFLLFFFIMSNENFMV